MLTHTIPRHQEWVKADEAAVEGMDEVVRKLEVEVVDRAAKVHAGEVRHLELSLRNCHMLASHSK
jgi:hypothetical protein